MEGNSKLSEALETLPYRQVFRLLTNSEQIESVSILHLINDDLFQKGILECFDVIAQCVRWYLAYSLSLRNLAEMMAEHGIHVDHLTLHRWILRITPIFNKIALRYKKPVQQFWHIDETYIKVKGQWYYLYRAID